MNNYVDEYSRYHHKPVTEVDPFPSNNGWIYTAYADKCGLPVDRHKLLECFIQCETFDGIGSYKLVRSPGKELPPMSRDEILGMSSLELLAPVHVPNWNFSPYPLPKFNLVTFIKQALECQGKDRNYFWQNKLEQMYHVAFSVPFADRHFILQRWGKFNLIYWAVAKFDSLLDSKSGIRYLKYDKDKEAMLAEFPADHPIRGK
jgi:hypothetical protein